MIKVLPFNILPSSFIENSDHFEAIENEKAFLVLILQYYFYTFFLHNDKIVVIPQTKP